MSLAIGQAKYNINHTNENQGFSSGLIIERNIKKLGIQAPPRTHFLLNDYIDILIGTSGLYELEDPEINITKVQLMDPEAYDILIDYIYETEGGAQI